VPAVAETEPLRVVDDDDAEVEAWEAEAAGVADA
jgi:hypothetical protein